MICYSILMSHPFLLSPEEQNKLRELQVGLVYLFGSQAEGVAGKLSDIDIGVVFTNPAIVHDDTFPVYGKLYDIFLLRLDQKVLILSCLSALR